MEFILQLIADLFLPEDIANQDSPNEVIEKNDVTEVVIAEEKESVEQANIFNLMEFH